MLKSQFVVIGAFLVLLCTASFSEVCTPLSTPEGNGQNELVMLHSILAPNTQFSIIPVHECVIREGASRKEVIEFADCIAESKCRKWKRFRDENSGDVKMVCQDRNATMEADSCEEGQHQSMN